MRKPRLADTIGSRATDDGTYPLARRWTIATGEQCRDRGRTAELGRNPDFAPQPTRCRTHFCVVDQNDPLDQVANNREIHRLAAPRRQGDSGGVEASQLDKTA